MYNTPAQSHSLSPPVPPSSGNGSIASHPLLVQLYPAAAGWYEAVWMGVLVGLVAAGMYDVGKVTIAGK